MMTRKLLICVAATILMAAFSTSVFSQARASLRGVTSDEFGAAIVGATVTLTDASGAAKTATTNADGAYVFSGLAPGKYKVHAIATGFAVSPDVDVDVATGRRDPVNISLKIAAIESQVKVNAEAPLSTDSSNNANQTVISGRDLDALPDDPDELAAALQALAGPSIGPNGGQILIDGFSGGNMPPKESIREIRINQNPFSAENDQPSARIEILTKPGSDKFRGNLSLNFTDESLNSRNPFAISSSKRTPFQQRQIGGNLSGPLKKGKASFFLEGNRNDTDDNEIVRATILDPSFNFVQIGQGVVVPRRFTNFSPRLDYAINARNTLVSRYSYNHNVTRNNGVNGFSLPERGYNNANTSQSFQVTETAVINATTVNETRFQFNHNRSESFADNTKPVLNVSGAFIGGGSQGGHSISTRNNWELSNFTQIQKGTHTIKFGGRVRGVSITDITPNNFGGQWTFNGGVTGLTSIQRYQRTLQLMQAGMTPTQIREAGGGAATFSIFAGNPLATVSQFDIEPYVQDDWRYKPNLTISYGLRYEIQNNAGSKLDFAPRVAIAWSPGAADTAHPPKTVFRFGGGVFYNRFSESNTLITHHNNAPLPPNYTTRPDPTRGEIYQYEASGKMHQAQMFVGFNSRLNPQFSLSGSYVLSKSTSDSDGPGSFPMNSYDLTSEFGRGSGDVRHRFNLFGTYNSKLWKLVFAPLITANSAPPFNIITGLDSNLDRIANERPTFAALSAYCSQFATRCAGVVPAISNASNDFIPRNFGIGHPQFTAALRITRTFGFGETARSAAANRARQNTTADAKRGAGGPGARGPMIAAGGGGGGGGERGGGGGMPGMMG